MTASYRDDPAWQDAQRRFVGLDSATGESADSRLVVGILAAIDLYRIERATETQAEVSPGGARAA